MQYEQCLIDQLPLEPPVLIGFLAGPADLVFPLGMNLELLAALVDLPPCSFFLAAIFGLM
jgi:hypothetical protein